MHILLTNNTLESLAGSELYVYDLALEFQRRGHRVTCFSLRLGLVADRLHERGVAATSDLAAVSDDVDIIHAHHRLEMRLAGARFPLVPLIFVSHGITHPLERPGESHAYVSRFVAVSEDVRRHMVANDGVPVDRVDVVPNFVDTERFYPRRPIPHPPRHVLVMSNHFGRGTTRSTIEEACRLAGDLELRVIGATTRSVWNVEDYIDWADVVITLGRGALQAMAMGRAVVIYDYRGGDGLVTPANFEDLAATNFSGRTYAKDYTPRQLAAEILGYDRDMVDSTTQLVRERRALRHIADQLLAIYARATEDFARMWPQERHQVKLRSALWELARYTARFKEEDLRRAELEWMQLLLNKREDELRQLREANHRLDEEARRLGEEAGRLEARSRELEAELERSHDLLRRIADGRVMRVMNGVQRLIGHLRIL